MTLSLSLNVDYHFNSITCWLLLEQLNKTADEGKHFEQVVESRTRKGLFILLLWSSRTVVMANWLNETKQNWNSFHLNFFSQQDSNQRLFYYNIILQFPTKTAKFLLLQQFPCYIIRISYCMAERNFWKPLSTSWRAWIKPREAALRKTTRETIRTVLLSRVATDVIPKLQGMMVGVHTDHDPTQRTDPIQTKDHAHVCCQTFYADDNTADQKYTFLHFYSNIPKLNFVEQDRKSMRRRLKYVKWW